MAEVTSALEVPWLNSLYDNYRTALMNRMYYGSRLASSRKTNRAIEIAVAVGSSGAIASWALWQSTDLGITAWAVLTGVSTVLAVVKPIVNYAKEIERYGKLFVGHGSLYYDLDSIVRHVAATKSVDDDDRARYERALDRRNEMAGDDDPKPNRKLVLKLQDRVDQMVPPESLWLPSE